MGFFSNLFKKKNVVKVEIIDHEDGLDEEDKKFVKEKVGNHYRLTKSARGKMINDDFNNNVAKFKKVIPKDYKEVMEFVREKEVEGLNREEALAFAFNAKVGIN